MLFLILYFIMYFDGANHFSDHSAVKCMIDTDMQIVFNMVHKRWANKLPGIGSNTKGYASM